MFKNKLQLYLTASLLTFVLLGAFGCASTPTETQESGKHSNLPENLRGGAVLYQRKCRECHGLYAPARLTDYQWRLIMDDMAAEARLDAKQEKSILAYLTAMN